MAKPDGFLETLVFRHHGKPHVFHRLTSASLERIKRLAYNSYTEVYSNYGGQQVVATWYMF